MKRDGYPDRAVEGGPPRRVEQLRQATATRSSAELVVAMAAARADDVDGAVKVVMARTAARQSRDPDAYRRLLRSGMVGYLVGRTSLGIAPLSVAPDPDGAAPADRARTLLRTVRDYDLRELGDALGPGAAAVVEVFASGAAPPAADELRRTALIGLGVAVAETELAAPEDRSDA